MSAFQWTMLALSLAGIAVGFSPLARVLVDHWRQLRIMRSGKPYRISATLVDGRVVTGVIDEANVETTLDFWGRLTEALEPTTA